MCHVQEIRLQSGNQIQVEAASKRAAVMKMRAHGIKFSLDKAASFFCAANACCSGDFEPRHAH